MKIRQAKRVLRNWLDGGEYRNSTMERALKRFYPCFRFQSQDGGRGMVQWRKYPIARG